MARSTGFTVIVAALLINNLSYCSAENVYCVIPTAASCSSCPHNSTHCTTLSEYAQEAELYFTTNTTMVFLPGDHTLDANITVANVTRLTMRGESSSGSRATVVCSGSVGLSFTNMMEFKMHSLAFTSCSRLLRYAIKVPCRFPLASVYAALHLQSAQYAELVNCSFHDNNGSALAVTNTSNTLAGNNFTHNHCESNCIGGGIIALSSNLSFTGNTTFLENRAKFAGTLNNSRAGGAIYASENTVLSFNGANNFIHNSADNGGGAIFMSHNTVAQFLGINNFINNSASYGGAISMLNNTVLGFYGISNFINNSAYNGPGGAISMLNNTVLSFNGANNFINNSASYGAGGGAIITSNNTVLSFVGASNFINNSAYSCGGAICALNNTILSFNGTGNFTNNSAYWGGAIHTINNSTLTFNGTIYFIDNGHYEGGDYSLDGYAYGGGVYIGLNSISILPNTTMYWENNHATFGGAIYVEDASPLSYCTTIAAYIPKEECFFKLPGKNLSNNIDVQLVFRNNSADDAGSVLYGGAIDNCKLTHGLDSYSSGKVFDMLVHNNDTDYNTSSNISSNPLRICLCENYFPSCPELGSRNQYNFPCTVYPGETFQVSVVAVGQRNGTVPSTVISSIDQGLLPGIKLQDYQYLQQASRTCTQLNYTVLSRAQTQQVDIGLDAEGSPCLKYYGYTLDITVKLHQFCPPGLNFSESARSCVCEPRLEQYTNNCTITNGVGNITRESGKQFWIGYDDQSQSEKLILHPLCPYHYCVNYNVIFPLNESNIQCANNRVGLLCGACKKGYSLVLGTSRCRKCTSNHHLYLLIPFAVMGVALVFLLLVCKLTVATGTLSGLVFYANIVGVNRTIFLPVESTDAFSVFIAWLNLDFGIETCFYDGMDAYSKTWLQFVFPVYIWVLVGLMILVSHFSHRFAKLLGNNPVSVLATLILLSYTKILRTLIAVFYITYLEYPTYNRSVWLYDANIDYLVGKHIPLFIMAMLVFLFFFLPYTLLLFFGQWLQALSHLRLFSWVNRLKPFMDSYHAPYKAKHRYWPGLLLVLRFVLLLLFALNPRQDPSVHLLAILVGTGTLVAWAWLSGVVYRNWCLDALESSFALNLIILAASTMYTMYISCSERSQFVNGDQLAKGNQLAIGYTSVSIALLTFIGILLYHIFQQLKHTQLWKKMPKLNLKFNRPNIVQAVNEPADNLAPEADFSQLREPLLEDLSQPNYGAF